MPLFSYQYSIPYLFVALVLFFLYRIEMRDISIGKSATIPRNIAFIIMVIFIGLRGHLHTDFINYYPYYEWIPTIFNLDGDSFFNIEYLFEPGFIIYTSICKTLVDNYFAWVFINTLIDLIVLYYACKQFCISRILPFFFLLAFYGLTLEFNTFRNIKALDLFLISTPFIFKKKFVPYLILNIIGMSFHISSLIYILIYPLLFKKISIRVILILVILVNIIYFLNIHITSSVIDVFSFLEGNTFNKLSNYQDVGSTYKFSFGYFERTSTMLLFIYLYHRLIQLNEKNVFLINCYLFYYLIHLFFSDVQVFSERIPLLFVFAYWFLYSNIFVLKNRFRQCIILFLMVLSISKITLGCSNITTYYDNVIWGVMSYEERASNVFSWMK